MQMMEGEPMQIQEGVHPPGIIFDMEDSETESEGDGPIEMMAEFEALESEEEPELITDEDTATQILSFRNLSPKLKDIREIHFATIEANPTERVSCLSSTLTFKFFYCLHNIGHFNIT